MQGDNGGLWKSREWGLQKSGKRVSGKEFHLSHRANSCNMMQLLSKYFDSLVIQQKLALKT